MRRKLFTIGLVAIITSSCSDFENFKFRNNLVNSGVYDSKAIKNTPKEIWKFETGGAVYSSIVADDKCIYSGSSDQYFYSINSETGELHWKFKTGGEISSTAIINNKFIYFLSYDGFLYKLNKDDGELIWKFKTEGEKKHLIKDYFNPKELKKDFWDFYQSSPTIFGNNIYFGCGEQFYAVNLKSGEKTWSMKTEGSVHSSPAIKENKIVFGSFDSRVYCLDANTGDRLWVFETGRDTAQYVWLGVQASPAIEGDRVYVGSRDALIYCLNLNTGDTIWTNNNFKRSWMPSSFAVGDNLYCGSSDAFEFYSIDKETGKIAYSINTNSYTFSSPAIDNSMAYIGSANGRLYGIDLHKNKIAWEYKTKGAISDTLGIFNEKGELDKDNYKKIAIKMDVSNLENYEKFYQLIFQNYGAILSSPVIHKGIIYYGSADGNIYAISDKK